MGGCSPSVSACALFIIVHLEKKKGAKSPEVLKDRSPFRNQGEKKLKPVSLSVRAATWPLASHLWIKFKGRKKKKEKKKRNRLFLRVLAVLSIDPCIPLLTWVFREQTVAGIKRIPSDEEIFNAPP